MTIIYLKDSSAEEALNMSEQGMSPESLEKTKDGSTFAAKARAAELQAGRAQQAVAADFDDDLTTLTPVTPESFTITRSCSRASHGGKPPNALTEQPKVTANETPILPTPSLPVLPIHSVPRHIVSIENFQSTAHPVSHQAAVFSETEGDDRSVTSEETVIPWQPHHRNESSVQRLQPSSIPRRNLSIEYQNQSNSDPVTRPLPAISGSKGQGSPVYSTRTVHYCPPPHQTQSSVEGLGQDTDPALSPETQSSKKQSIRNRKTKVNAKRSPYKQGHKPSEQAKLATPSNSRQSLVETRRTRETPPQLIPTIPLTYTNGTPRPERSRNRSSKYNTATIPHPDQPQPPPTFNKYRDFRDQEPNYKQDDLWHTPAYYQNHIQNDYWRTSANQNHTQNDSWRTSAYQDHNRNGSWRTSAYQNHDQNDSWRTPAYQNHDQNDSWRTSAYQNQVAMRPSSNAPSYGRGIPESLQNPRLDELYRRALTSVPYSGSGDPLRRPRDAKPYTNPYMPRTVAYDPIATVPTTVTASSVTSKSTLKPEAPVYTPKSAGDKGLGSTRPNTKAHGMAGGIGNGAMTSFVEERKRETAEDAVTWFHSKPMQKEVEAVLQQAQEHTKAMTAPLASGSFPDEGNTRRSLGPALPKPIGYGRPSPTRAPSTTATTPHQLTKQFDGKAVDEMMASTIANLKQHENPVPGDYFTRYRSAHACEVDQGPDGNKSLFDPAWGTPPSRVSRDPRRIGQGGSGGVSGTFGRC